MSYESKLEEKHNSPGDLENELCKFISMNSPSFVRQLLERNEIDLTTTEHKIIQTPLRLAIDNVLSNKDQNSLEILNLILNTIDRQSHAKKALALEELKEVGVYHNPLLHEIFAYLDPAASVNDQSASDKRTVLHTVLDSYHLFSGANGFNFDTMLQLYNYLIPLGAKINIQDNMGRTPTHLFLEAFNSNEAEEELPLPDDKNYELPKWQLLRDVAKNADWTIKDYLIPHRTPLDPLFNEKAPSYLFGLSLTKFLLENREDNILPLLPKILSLEIPKTYPHYNRCMELIGEIRIRLEQIEYGKEKKLGMTPLSQLVKNNSELFSSKHVIRDSNVIKDSTETTESKIQYRSSFSYR